MTKREIERTAVETVGRYESIAKTDDAYSRAMWNSRIAAVLDFCESLGIKRARLVRAVKEEQ